MSLTDLSLDDNPGDWAISWDDLGPFRPDDCVDTVTRQTLIGVAVNTIWHLTGRRIGVHTLTGRPCVRCACTPGFRCGCRWYDTIDLDPSGQMPVRTISSVAEWGVVLDPAVDYAVGNNRWLLRTPNGSRWATCGDVIPADPTDVAVEISWTAGYLPSLDLQYNGVAALVAQLWSAWNRRPCSLNPATVQSVQREGISFALISQGEVWRDGYTGDPVVDGACVRAWPHGPRVSYGPGIFDPAKPLPTMARAEHPTPPAP